MVKVLGSSTCTPTKKRSPLILSPGSPSLFVLFKVGSPVVVVVVWAFSRWCPCCCHEYKESSRYVSLVTVLCCPSSDIYPIGYIKVYHIACATQCSFLQGLYEGRVPLSIGLHSDSSQIQSGFNIQTITKHSTPTDRSKRWGSKADIRHVPPNIFPTRNQPSRSYAAFSISPV